MTEETSEETKGVNKPWTGKPKEVQTAMKRERALRLRSAGVGYDVIAQECGYASRSGAWKAVNVGLAEIVTEAAQDLVKLEYGRLDQLHTVWFQRAMQGDRQAAIIALRIIDARVKLMGTAAPDRIEVVTLSQLDQQIADLERELGYRPGEAIEDVDVGTSPNGSTPQG